MSVSPVRVVDLGNREARSVHADTSRSCGQTKSLSVPARVTGAEAVAATSKSLEIENKAGTGCFPPSTGRVYIDCRTQGCLVSCFAL